MNAFDKVLKRDSVRTNDDSFKRGDMSANEYQRLALSTANPELDSSEQLINGLMGLCGEAGEVTDIAKKWMFQGHELDVEHLAKELSDCAWYLALAADSIGYDLGAILKMNIDKLKKRYPEGFKSELSQHRKAGDE